MGADICLNGLPSCYGGCVVVICPLQERYLSVGGRVILRVNHGWM